MPWAEMHRAFSAHDIGHRGMNNGASVMNNGPSVMNNGASVMNNGASVMNNGAKVTTDAPSVAEKRSIGRDRWSKSHERQSKSHEQQSKSHDHRSIVGERRGVAGRQSQRTGGCHAFPGQQDPPAWQHGRAGGGGWKQTNKTKMPGKCRWQMSKCRFIWEVGARKRVWRGSCCRAPMP